MISLSDVAKKSGVSIATVSLALRGRGQVAANTAERIRSVADELGYKPNPLLASLAARQFRSRSSVEGTPLAILQFPLQTGLSRPAVDRRYPQDILPHARDLGYSPTIYKVGNQNAPHALFRELYHRMVQGIIIVGSMEMETFGAQVPWDEFSVIACARFANTLPFHTVRPNIFQGIKLAFEKLRQRGYRRIGFALGQHENPMEDDEARHGTAIVLENRYIPKADRIPPYDGDIHSSESFAAWVKKQRPDVVLGFSVGQYWFLRDMGLRIPEDIGFACLHLDGSSESRLLCGLQQNRTEIAKQAVRQLDQLVRNHEKGLPELPLHVLVPSTWVEGKTLADKAGS